MSKLRLGSLVAGLSAGAAIIGLPSASAHDVCAWHTYDVACVQDNHQVLKTCDGEADGHAVRAQYTVLLSDRIFVGSWDTTTNAGCVFDRLPLDANQFRVCENDVGCSGWKPK